MSVESSESFCTNDLLDDCTIGVDDVDTLKTEDLLADSSLNKSMAQAVVSNYKSNDDLNSHGQTITNIRTNLKITSSQVSCKMGIKSR